MNDHGETMTAQNSSPLPYVSCRLPAPAVQTHASYVTVTMCRRATYRFANPRMTKIQWVFFTRPRYRTLDHPRIRLITKNICLTLARTFDFGQFLARSSSLRG